MNLWVVMGQYGEYEDTCYWAVAAYTNSEEAEAHAQRANDWWKAAKAAMPPHQHAKAEAFPTVGFDQMTVEQQKCWVGRCEHPGTNPFDSIGVPETTDAQMRVHHHMYVGCSGDWYYVDGPIPLVNKPC